MSSKLPFLISTLYEMALKLSGPRCHLYILYMSIQPAKVMSAAQDPRLRAVLKTVESTVFPNSSLWKRVIAWDLGWSRERLWDCLGGRGQKQPS